jgi:Ser/Thr protein kinase RdoA (MazF antagonist)
MSSSDLRSNSPVDEVGRPLIVEFVGTPGSGKTTLSIELVDLLKEHGIEAATVVGAAREHARRTLAGRLLGRVRPGRLRGLLLWQLFYLLGVFHTLGFVREQPALIRQVLRGQLRSPIPIARRRHLLFWFFQLAGRYSFLATTSRAGEALVLDDGFLHRAVHLHASHVKEPDAEQVTAYVDLVPRPDLVVFTAADRKVCERRVRERGVWRHSRHLSTAELSRYVDRGEWVTRLTVQRARERGWTVVEIHNGGRGLDRVRCDLRRALDSCIVAASPTRHAATGPRANDLTRILRVPRPSRVSAYVTARLGPPAIHASTVRTVLERYGLEAVGPPRNLRLGRRSLNAAVKTDRGEKVIKRYRPQWKRSTVWYGHSILVRLEELDFPAVRLERTGLRATWTMTTDEIFAVFDLVKGTNYSLNFLLRPDRLRLTVIAGSTLARFHRCLDGFVPDGEHHLGFVSPVGDRRRNGAWHATKLDELKSRSLELTDFDAVAHARRLISQAGHVIDEINRLGDALSQASFPRLIIHGDYGLHNLIFQPTGAVPVDFEVSRLDWRLNDLISALGKYRYRGGHYDFESMQTFMSAYASEFPLTADEQRLLPDAWRLYKLQAAVQYWNSFFETNGPTRKLASALDAIEQADWVVAHPDVIRALGWAAGDAAPAQQARRPTQIPTPHRRAECHR